MTEPTCPRCSQIVSADDPVKFDGHRVVHVDCRNPRSLSREERALLYRYCWNHPIGECVACARTFRQNEMVSDLVDYRCAHCRRDLTDSVRAHLYGCSTLPEEVRRRAQETRQAARTLVKQTLELSDRADVLMREAEVAVAALRDAMRQSASEALHRLIQTRLRDGSLPRAGVPPTIQGRPGDGSTCGACDQAITKLDLMMIVTREASPLSAPHEVTPIALHTDCFQIWNEARRSFKTSA